jgi:uncharacterized protein YhaN
VWIERLRVQGFPPFQDEQDLSLEAGLWVLMGANESGKTRLTEAIRGAIFGFDARSGEWDEGFTEITVHVGARCFLIRRELPPSRVTISERTAQGVEVLHDERLGETGSEERLFAALGTLFGISAETIWLRSGLVQNGNLITELDEAVRSWLVGNPQGDEEAILARVEEDLAHLAGKDGQPGELERVRREIADRESLLARWQGVASRWGEARETWQAKEGELRGATERARSQGDLLQNLERFEHLAQERARLENSLVELREDRDRIRRHLETEEQARALLESQYAEFLNAPDDIEDGIHSWIEGSNRLQSVERDIVRLEGATAALPPSRTTRNGIIVAAGMGVLSWLAGMGAGEPRLGMFLFPLFASAGFGIVWAMERSSERVRAAHAAERARLNSEREEAAASLDAARRALGKLSQFESPAALRRHFRGYMEVQEKLERARTLSSRLRPLSVTMDEYEDVLSQLQVLDTETRDLVAHAQYLSGQDADLAALKKRVETVRRERDEAEGEAQRLERETQRLHADLGSLEKESPEPGRVAEELETLRAQETDLARREAAARVAAEMLRDALRDYQEDHLARVALRGGQLFERLTGGKYRGLRFNPDSEPEVRVDGAWTDPACLSEGAREQIHFCIRIALSEDGSAERALPIVLDEPFRGWDDARVAEAHRLLVELGQAGRQCLVLGSDARLTGWSGRSITLDGSTSVTRELRAA